MKFVVTYLTPGKRVFHTIEAPTEQDALDIAWRGEKPRLRVYANLYAEGKGPSDYPPLTDFDPSLPIYHSRHSYGWIPCTAEAKRLGLDDGDPIGLGLMRCHELGERCYCRGDGKLFTYPKGELLIPKRNLEQVEKLFRYIPIRVYAKADGSFDRAANLERWCYRPLVDWLEEQENK